MVAEYFHKTQLDIDFFEEHIRPRLPDTILDAHQHLTLKSFGRFIDTSKLAEDWARECYSEMSIEDMEYYADVMFPGIKFSQNALTTVTKGACFDEANDYLANLLKTGRVPHAMMTLDPTFSNEKVERMLTEDGFTGIKPYPDLVTGQKAAETSIFECLPHEKLEIVNRLKKGITLHIPRAGRLADPNNVREIKEIHDKYPDAKLIIAHYGRSYSTGVFEEGARQLGDYMHELTFDMAAVLNPAVLEMAFEVMDPKKIMWGTDLPVFLWHGRRHWTEYKYFNLAREDFKWNRHEESPEVEATYTFFLYEQMKNILDVIDKIGGGKEMAEDIFHRNAERILGAAREGKAL